MRHTISLYLKPTEKVLSYLDSEILQIDNITEDTTIDELMQIITNMTKTENSLKGLPSTSQYLTLDYSELKQDKTVSDYDIRDGTTITLGYKVENTAATCPPIAHQQQTDYDIIETITSTDLRPGMWVQFKTFAAEDELNEAQTEIYHTKHPFFVLKRNDSAFDPCRCFLIDIQKEKLHNYCPRMMIFENIYLLNSQYVEVLPLKSVTEIYGPIVTASIYLHAQKHVERTNQKAIQIPPLFDHEILKQAEALGQDSRDNYSNTQRLFKSKEIKVTQAPAPNPNLCVIS